MTSVPPTRDFNVGNTPCWAGLSVAGRGAGWSAGVTWKTCLSQLPRHSQLVGVLAERGRVGGRAAAVGAAFIFLYN